MTSRSISTALGTPSPVPSMPSGGEWAGVGRYEREKQISSTRRSPAKNQDNHIDSEDGSRPSLNRRACFSHCFDFTIDNTNCSLMSCVREPKQQEINAFDLSSGNLLLETDRVHLSTEERVSAIALILP